MLVNTENRLFVLVHRHVPRAIVMSEPIAELEGVGWPDWPVSLHGPGDWPRSFDELHPWLHMVLGNECEGKTLKPSDTMRNGNYSQFGGLVRLGYDPPLRRDGETGAPIVLGCYDTPCMDVDAVRISDGRVVGLVELKRRHERELTRFQRFVMKSARGMGVPYEELRGAKAE